MIRYGDEKKALDIKFDLFYDKVHDAIPCDDMKDMAETFTLQDAIILNSQGCDLVKEDKLIEAIESFNSALDIAVQGTELYGIILNNKGHTYALMGDKETAREMYELALKVLPEDETIKDNIKNL